MLKVYPAVFRQEDDLSYWVEFPNLEGCYTCGKNLEETMELAEEALGLYIVSLQERGIEIPVPSDIKQMSINDGFTTLVSTDIDKYRRKNKSIKKTLTIPEWLNEEAEKHHVNFSSVLQNALIEHLKLN